MIGMSLSLSGIAYAASQPKKVPIGEFEPVRGILFSEYLFAQEQIGQQILKATSQSGVEVYVLLDRDTTPGDPYFLHKDYKLPLHKPIIHLGLRHDHWWLRDFFPLFARRDRTLVGIQFLYRPDNGGDQSQLPGLFSLMKTPVIKVAEPLDGGNYLTDGENCFLSDLFFNHLSPDNLRGVNQVLKTEMGCGKVVVIDQSPHEHIDMFATATGRGRFMVSDISEQMLRLISQLNPEFLPAAKEMRSTLNAVAAQFRKHGEVNRIPTPFPTPSEITFYSYTNVIYLNGIALVPTYTHALTGRGPAWVQLAKIEQEQVESIYRAEGFDVHFIDISRLIAQGGGLHCVALTLPKRLL